MNGHSEQPTRQRIVARAVIIGPRGCLVQHKQTLERGDYFGLPGGAKEDFETLIEALQREAREEMGCSLLAPELIGIADYRRREESGGICDRTECLFSAQLPEGYEPGNGPKPDRNQKGMVWLSLDRVAQSDFSPPYIRDVLLRIAESGTHALGYLGAYADTRLDETQRG